MSNTKDKFWQALSSAEHWDKLRPPTRPSPGFIKFIERILGRKKNRKLNVLILGATSEFRDLAAKNCWNSVVVDISRERLLQLRKLMCYPYEREEPVVADWVKAPLRENYFDLILGDVVFANIPYSKQKRLLQKIRLWLKPNGLLIERYMPHIPPEQELAVYVKQYLRPAATLKDLSVFDMLVKRFTYDNRQKRISNQPKAVAVRRIVGRCFYQNQSVKKWLAIFPPVPKCWWSLTKEEWERLVVEYFKIKQVYYATDYPLGGDYPIYVMRKK